MYNLVFEFFLNVFTEFSKFSDKNICHNSERAQTCHPGTIGTYKVIMKF